MLVGSLLGGNLVVATLRDYDRVVGEAIRGLTLDAHQTWLSEGAEFQT